jgi:murein DD-endopeptidase MepM/ murein hydrolase activator NlpD
MAGRMRVALLVSLLSLSALASPARVTTRRIESGQTLGNALYKTDLPTAQVESLLSALEGVFDVRKVREGDQWRLVVREGEVDQFDYRQSELDEWQVRREGDKLVALKRAVEVEKQIARVELAVDSSLYEAALTAGEDPTIAMALADVFAWDVDFYQDVRKGDHVKALVEKYVTQGRLVRYGEVLAAEYDGETVGTKKVFRYELPSGDYSYFQQDGQSARKSFLKSPLKYAHVTSRFGMRFHPVLQYVKAHEGVDYGAAIGTPVWAVADGTVTRAGPAGAGGNTLCIRHRNGWESCYCHLSRFGAGVHVGARVAQKQVVALSGNTGRTTGPHLHFALKRDGHFVNPLNQHFPRADPVPASLAEDFRQKVAPIAAQLSATSVAAAVPASAR